MSRCPCCCYASKLHSTMSLEEVNHAIAKLFKVQTLQALSDSELKVLPDVLIFQYKRDIYKVWEKLPISFTQQRCIDDFFPCLLHYNKGRTHIDGPAPLVYQCYQCQHYK